MVWFGFEVVPWLCFLLRVGLEVKKRLYIESYKDLGTGMFDPTGSCKASLTDVVMLLVTNILITVVNCS